MSQTTIYTIGHSNHAIDEFLSLLKQHEIEVLVDIRRFPSSRRLPHFNRHDLAKALGEHGIEYHWPESLGGHRKKGLADSPNVGIRDVDLVQEPFVSGVPEMIDELVAEIPNARQGFRLLLSAAPFPDYQRKLTRLREEFEGWWYRSDEPETEGWLWSALFRYFDEVPDKIYVKAEAK